MIIKNFEINNHINSEKNFFLFYGINSGFIDETINKYFKPNYLENIFIYDETDAISNENLITESVFNKSLFNEKKLIIINRVTDKIFF